MASAWLPTTIYKVNDQVIFLGSTFTSTQNYNLNQPPNEDGSVWWSAPGGGVANVVAGTDITLGGTPNLPIINVTAGASRSATITDLPIPGAGAGWAATYTQAFTGNLEGGMTAFTFELQMYAGLTGGGTNVSVNWDPTIDRMVFEVWTTGGSPTRYAEAVFTSVGNGLLPADATAGYAKYTTTQVISIPATAYQLRVTVLNRSHALAYPTGQPTPPPGSPFRFTSAQAIAVPFAGVV
jgi:hypothetical protein